MMDSLPVRNVIQTMKVRFYLHNTVNKNGTQVIMCQYSHGGKRDRFSTKRSVHKKHFSQQKQRVVGGNTDTRFSINDKLAAIEAKLYGIARGLDDKLEEPTPSRVLAIYHGKVEKLSFWEAYAEFEKNYLQGQSKGTQRHYKVSFETLIKYEAHRGTKIQWEHLNLNFIEGFRTFERLNGNSKNTINGKVKDLKRFLTYSEKAGWVDIKGVHKDWESKIKKRSKHEEKPYSNDMELLYLERFEFPPRLQRVIDLYLFTADCKLRHSELREMKTKDLIGNILYYHEPKTSQINEAKLTKRALRIWNKYAGNIPVISNSKLNQYLKESFELAGIDEPVRYQGKTVAKYKAVTIHMARSSLATRLLDKGIPLERVRDIMGHSDSNTTKIYDRAQLEDIRDTVDILEQSA